jgi:hypothetical protein
LVVSPSAVAGEMDAGSPRIQFFGSDGDIYFMPHMMEPGDDVLVVARLKEVFAGATATVDATAVARL